MPSNDVMTPRYLFTFWTSL